MTRLVPPKPIYEGFVRRLFLAALDSNLRSGLPMKVLMNGTLYRGIRAAKWISPRLQNYDLNSVS
jgi:hypothetical protein